MMNGDLPLLSALCTTQILLDLFLDRAMTTSEAHSATAVEGDWTWKRRCLAWAAAILLPLAILGVTAKWPRTRVDPQLLWNEAHNALQSGDLAAAEAKLASIRRLRAPTSFDWSLTAQIAITNGRPDEALSALDHIPHDDALAAQGFLLAGRVERQRNRMPAAEAYFRKALNRDPVLIGAHKELIYILGLQLRRREVDAEFKILARLTALTHQELYTWGVTHFNFLYNVWAQDTAEHLESFILADPGDRYSRLSLATLLVKAPGAEARLEQILEPLSRSDPEATALLIESRFEHGRVEEAIAMLQGTSTEHPKLARIRGRVSLMRGDLTAAIRYFNAALTEEPYDRISVSELGKALVLAGDKSAAESYLTRARRLDTVYTLLSRVRQPDRENQASDLTQFGGACESAGLIDEARGWYLLAIERDPLNAEAQQALQRLRNAGTSSLD
jgi:tetratricopeptide (TPR) repeat protein